MFDDDSATSADPSQAATGVAPTEHIDPDPVHAWSEVSKFGHFDDDDEQVTHRSWAVPVAGGIVAAAALALISFAVMEESHATRTVTVTTSPSTVTESPSTITEPPSTLTEPPATVTEPPTTVTDTVTTPRPPADYNPPEAMPQDSYANYDAEFLARLRNVPGFVITDPARLVWWGRHTCGMSRGGSTAQAEAEMMRGTGESLAGVRQILATAELVYPGCGAGI